MRTAPASGRSKRPATCRRVDFPAPDGPTSATISPLARFSETPRSTSRLWPACLKVRTTPSSASADSLITERLDRIEPRRAPGGIERREERQAEGQGHHADDVGRVDLRGNAGKEIELRREDIEPQVGLEKGPDRRDVRGELDADDEARERSEIGRASW